MNRKAMYKLSYGLFILTAKEAEKDNGCIINTAIQAASEPNQLSICVNKANYTHDMIQRTGKFTVPFSPNAFVPIPYAARYNHIDACPMGQLQ